MPLWVGGAVAIGGLAGLAGSYMASESAKDLDAATRAQVGAAIAKFEKNFKLPDLDKTPLTQEEFRLIGQYAPQIASYIQEKSPEMITEVDSTREKGLQSEALSRYQNLSQQGNDVIGRAEQEAANAAVEGERLRNQEQVLRAYQNQGLGGGGQALQAALSSNQAADAARRQASLQANADNQNRRLNALGKMADLASSMRNQNTNVEKANVSAINAFNERNARNKQNYEMYVAEQRNAAQAANLAQQQAIANANTGLRNQVYLANRDRADSQEQIMRDAHNSQQRDMLNAATGQAAMGREHGKDEIQRTAGMWNQIGALIPNTVNAYAASGGFKQGAPAQKSQTYTTAGEPWQDPSKKVV